MLGDDIFIFFFRRHVVDAVAFLAAFVIVEVAVSLIDFSRLDFLAIHKKRRNFDSGNPVLLQAERNLE